MRKFLYTIVIGVILVGIVAFSLALFWRDLSLIAFVPSEEFQEQEVLADNAYANPDLWLSRPGMGAPNDPARWQPAYRVEEGEDEEGAVVEAEPEAAEGAEEPTATPDFAVFFVHPTSYINSTSWNAPLDDEPSQDLAVRFVRSMGSAFNQASEIWAPKYRQATFGAFLTQSEDSARALNAAYADVKQAFDRFIASVDADMPIVLAGHSQGSLHLITLLSSDLADDPVKDRIAAAYIVGWPISIEHDLPLMGLPACATADQAGCIMSWQSFAEPADPSAVVEAYSALPGLDGEDRAGSPMLCSNPLTGGIGTEASAERNLGTLVAIDDGASAELVCEAVPARCGPNGFLLIGEPPEMGNAVQPGNNYHVYDIPLFWTNLQQDVTRRVAALEQTR